MDTHGAEFYLHHCKSYHHHNSQKCVKIVRDRLDKDRKSVFTFHIAGYRSSPRRNRRNDTHRSRRRINQIGKLSSGHLMAVCHRPHNASHSQTVEIIINENQNPKGNRHKLCPDSCTDPFSGPLPESSGSPRLVHHADDNA